MNDPLLDLESHVHNAMDCLKNAVASAKEARDASPPGSRLSIDLAALSSDLTQMQCSARALLTRYDVVRDAIAAANAREAENEASAERSGEVRS